MDDEAERVGRSTTATDAARGARGLVGRQPRQPADPRGDRRGVSSAPELSAPGRHPRRRLRRRLVAAAARELGVPQDRLHGVDLLETRVSADARSATRSGRSCKATRERSLAGRPFWLVTLFLVLSSQDSRGDQLRSLAEAQRVLAARRSPLRVGAASAEPAQPRDRGPCGSTAAPRARPEPSTSRPVTVLPFLARRLRDPTRDLSPIGRFAVAVHAIGWSTPAATLNA